MSWMLFPGTIFVIRKEPSGSIRNLRFIWDSEQIVVGPHHFLVGADEKQPDIVLLVFLPLGEFQSFLYILEVYELVNLPIGVACDIDECRKIESVLVEPMNGQNGKQLSDCPGSGAERNREKLQRYLLRELALRLRIPRCALSLALIL